MMTGMICRINRVLAPFAEFALGFSVSGGLGLADIFHERIERCRVCIVGVGCMIGKSLP